VEGACYYEPHLLLDVYASLWKKGFWYLARFAFVLGPVPVLVMKPGEQSDEMRTLAPEPAPALEPEPSAPSSDSKHSPLVSVVMPAQGAYCHLYLSLQ
jgi:hypothetical protein